MAKISAAGGNRKKVSPITLVVSVVVILIVVTAVIVMFVMNSGARTPESTFRKMVDGMNDGDFQQVYETSIYSLNMTYPEFIAWIGEDAETDYDIEIDYLEIILKGQLTTYEVNYIEQLLPELESGIDDSVVDYGMIDVSLDWTETDDTGSDTESMTGLIVFLKVDSKWYLLFPVDEFYQE